MQSFRVWIKQFKGAHSPIGDLADNIAADKDFPKSNNYEVIHNYLKNTEALRPFELAWKHYKDEIDTKDAHYRLGVRLEFVRLLVMSIQCDSEINEFLRGKESSCLWRMEKDLSEIKSNMESLIFDNNREWADTGVYYGNSELLDGLRNKTLCELDDIAKNKLNNSDIIK